MTRRNQILIALVAFLAAAGAFYQFVLSPKKAEITQLDSDIAAKEAELAQSQGMLATYEKARASYKRNYTVLARLGKAVPADDDVRSLLVQIEATADNTGVDFQEIELGSGLAGGSGSSTEETKDDELASAPGAVPVAGGALSAMPFSFTFAGEYFELSTFLAKLEHFVSVNNERVDATGRLLRIESVAIAPSGAGFPDMQAQIGAATYIVPPVEGVKSGSSAPSTTQQASSSEPSSEPGTSTTTATAGAAQ